MPSVNAGNRTDCDNPSSESVAVAVGEVARAVHAVTEHSTPGSHCGGFLSDELPTLGCRSANTKGSTKRQTDRRAWPLPDAFAALPASQGCSEWWVASNRADKALAAQTRPKCHGFCASKPGIAKRLHPPGCRRANDRPRAPSGVIYCVVRS